MPYKTPNDPRRKRDLLRYNHSQKGKRCRARYRATKKGQLSHRGTLARWRKSKKGKRWNKRYAKLPRVKKAKLQYNNSEKGKIAHKRYDQSSML